jgi:PKD repeat protein
MDRVLDLPDAWKRWSGLGTRSSGEAETPLNACRLPVRAALLGLICASMLGLGASSASAVIVHLASGHTLSYQSLPGAAVSRPFDELLHNLDYGGGPVMVSNTNYAVYWDPSGAPAYPSDYRSGVNTYFEDLAHDSGGHENADSVSTQYNDAAGEFASYDSHFGGALLDTNPYPASGCTRAATCLTDAQIRTELVRFVKEEKLRADLTHEYYLLTPKGVESCFEPAGFACSAGIEPPFDAYCAYHGNIPVANEGELIYANDPYVTGGICDDGNHPNNTTADAVLSGGLSHEHNESLTDPEPNNAWTDWATGSSTGYEIGDKCRTFIESSEFGTPLGKAPDGAKYNQVINGHLYWYQQEWSNQGHQCLQRLTFTGEESKATFTSTVAVGDQVKFDASGSTAGVGVHYDWQFNDSGAPTAPVETTAETVSHTFPANGTYTVALTVFTADGTSIGTDRRVEVKTPQTIKFTTVAPSAAIVGGAGYAVAATASSKLAVSFSSPTPAVCAVAGSTVSFLGAGTCTVDANQAGNAEYLAAPQRHQSFAVSKGSQTIGFTTVAPSAAIVGGPSYAVAATASSGLAVSFSSATPAVCVVAGSTVSFLGAGKCTVDADQAGNTTFGPAPQAQQSFAVSPMFISTLTSTPTPTLTSTPTSTPTLTSGQGVAPFQQSVRLLVSNVRLGAKRGRRGRTELDGGAAIGERAAIDIRRHVRTCRNIHGRRRCSTRLTLHEHRSIVLLARQFITLPASVTVKLSVVPFTRHGSNYAATRIERSYH